MTRPVVRYVFDDSISLDEVESSLLLAVWGCESLHGTARVRLETAHRLDRERRTCEIEAVTDAGRDLNRLFLGYLRREFGDELIRIERVDCREVAHCPCDPTSRNVVIGIV